MSHKVVYLTEIKNFDEAVAWSADRPVFIYKHSSTCPVSTRAANHFNDFIKTDKFSPTPLFTQVLVIENREISNEIESRLDVRHESPQLLLLKNRKVVWHASHFDITEENIKSALEN